jgi:hypothetical protein
LGFINCVWHYKILLLNENDGILRGDNFTIGNKLHILSDFFINENYRAIDVLVEKINDNINESRISDISNLDSIGLISYKNPSDINKNPSSDSDNYDYNNHNYNYNKRKIIKNNNNHNNHNQILSPKEEGTPRPSCFSKNSKNKKNKLNENDDENEDNNNNNDKYKDNKIYNDKEKERENLIVKIKESKSVDSKYNNDNNNDKNNNNGNNNNDNDIEIFYDKNLKCDSCNLNKFILRDNKCIIF